MCGGSSSVLALVLCAVFSNASMDDIMKQIEVQLSPPVDSSLSRVIICTLGMASGVVRY